MKAKMDSLRLGEAYDQTVLSLAEHYRLVAPSIPKVFVRDIRDEKTVATALCIAPGLMLTCAHVVLAHSRLDEIPPEELSDWRAYLAQHVRSIELVDQDNREHACEIAYCDPALDVALITTTLEAPPLAFDPAGALEPGMDVAYFGYPYTIQTQERHWPFSVYRGAVSALADVCIGGSERRPFVVIHGLTLGSVSGGPVFELSSGALVGMMNGQMYWGRDDVLIIEKDEQDNHRVGDTHTPLPVSFGTSFSFLRERGFSFTPPATLA